MSETQCFFLSQQPIVGVERRFVAWELVFGSADGETLSPDPRHSEEYSAALQCVATTAPWESLLCGGRALLRVNRRQLFCDLLEGMPNNRLWLGIDPSVDVDANLSKRLHSLHGLRGTRLFFFGYVSGGRDSCASDGAAGV